MFLDRMKEAKANKVEYTKLFYQAVDNGLNDSLADNRSDEAFIFSSDKKATVRQNIEELKKRSYGIDWMISLQNTYGGGAEQAYLILDHSQFIFALNTFGKQIEAKRFSREFRQHYSPSIFGGKFGRLGVIQKEAVEAYAAAHPGSATDNALKKMSQLK